ncbi:hypothetical protein HanIR_Chr12g0601551 [Helianthus annuus]|nr:hypothetical protein HanIR_Chr12g0601551 [Helianthus annuus]
MIFDVDGDDEGGGGRRHCRQRRLTVVGLLNSTFWFKPGSSSRSLSPDRIWLWEIILGSVQPRVSQFGLIKNSQDQRVWVNKDIWSAGSSLGSRYIIFGSVDSVKPSRPGHTESTRSNLVNSVDPVNSVHVSTSRQEIW